MVIDIEGYLKGYLSRWKDLAEDEEAKKEIKGLFTESKFGKARKLAESAEKITLKTTNVSKNKYITSFEINGITNSWVYNEDVKLKDGAFCSGKFEEQHSFPYSGNEGISGSLNRLFLRMHLTPSTEKLTGSNGNPYQVSGLLKESMGNAEKEILQSFFDAFLDLAKIPYKPYLGRPASKSTHNNFFYDLILLAKSIDQEIPDIQEIRNLLKRLIFGYGDDGRFDETNLVFLILFNLIRHSKHPFFLDIDYHHANQCRFSDFWKLYSEIDGFNSHVQPSDAGKLSGYLGAQKDWVALKSTVLPEIDDLNILEQTYFIQYVNEGGDVNPVSQLLSLKNIILYGPPGTGKTYKAKELAKSITTEGRIKIVQFHPSYSYEDFIEGLRPVPVNGGENIIYEVVDGTFKTFCSRALEAGQSISGDEEPPKFVFIIDEINRADLSRVLGELMLCLEDGYRVDMKKDLSNQLDLMVDLPISNSRSKEEKESKNYYLTSGGDDKFFIPDNVYVIGTMNTIDRSVESFDFALRRRFGWHHVPFNSTVLYEVLSKKYSLLPEQANLLCEKAKKLNQEIVESFEFEKDKQIGHTYFFKIDKYLSNDSPNEFNQRSLICLWQYHIEPLLKEYLGLSYDEPNVDVNIKKIRKTFVSI